MKSFSIAPVTLSEKGKILCPTPDLLKVLVSRLKELLETEGEDTTEAGASMVEVKYWSLCGADFGPPSPDSALIVQYSGAEDEEGEL